jgi:hypothetical protein
MAKGKVEIIDVKLDINLEEEIKKQTVVDSTAKSRIESIIERAKLRADKAPKPKEVDEMEPFFKVFFDSLIANKEVNQEESAKLLNVPTLQLGAVLGKFKKFLRVSKNNEFVLFIGKNGKQKVYYLKRLSDPL